MKNIDLAKASKVAGLIDYQEGSVVSKAIIELSAGTVTLFAFDKGQSLSEHTAPFDALINVVEGEAEATVSGVKYKVTEGEVMLMPANEPHSLRAIDRFKMVLTMIKK